MENPDLNLENGSAPANANQGQTEEARKSSIQRCIQSLVHACQCRDGTCKLAACQKMKRVVMHTKVCKRKTNGGCPICKQLVALCCYHANHCQEAKCLVPFCSNIKYKMKQQQLQQDILLRRKMAKMSLQNTSAGSVEAKIEPGVSSTKSLSLGQMNIGNQPGMQQEARKSSIQRCIQSLVHACRCRDATCKLASCQKMKRVVMHTKVCKRKTNGGCAAVCKQLVALCCYHANHCQEAKCLVPFCLNLKYKLKQQRLQDLNLERVTRLFRKTLVLANAKRSG